MEECVSESNTGFCADVRGCRPCVLWALPADPFQRCLSGAGDFPCGSNVPSGLSFAGWAVKNVTDAGRKISGKIPWKKLRKKISPAKKAAPSFSIQS